ncbi:hypothetical protein EI555_008630, partial [Monodon monoceros]
MGGGVACRRTSCGQTSCSPAPTGPTGGLNRSPAMRRTLMHAPTPGRAGAPERGMEGPAYLEPVALCLLAATRVLRTLRGRSRRAVGARGAGRRAGAPRRLWASCPQPASPRPRPGHEHSVKLRPDSAADSFSRSEDLCALQD